jgi:hypothetical protein
MEVIVRDGNFSIEAQGAFEKAQDAQELKLRCIRQAGTILLPPEQGGMTMREERKGAGRPPADKEIIASSDLTQFQETLEQAGITRETGNTWQKVARVPEDKEEFNEKKENPYLLVVF